MPSAADGASGPNIGWLESLPVWPEEFGLDRMRSLLRELGDPQRTYRAVHVVGSKGKSTAARTIGALL
jgi:dihydrofolate synthase/folylpolyglutamate synthase